MQIRTLCTRITFEKKKKSHDQGHTCTHIWNVLRHYIKGTGTYCRVLYFFINLPHSGTLWSSIKRDIFTATPTPSPLQGILGKVFRHALLSQSKGVLLVLGEKRPGMLRGILWHMLQTSGQRITQTKTSMPKWMNPVLYLKYRTVYEASVNQVGTKLEDALEIQWKPGGGSTRL